MSATTTTSLRRSFKADHFDIASFLFTGLTGAATFLILAILAVIIGNIIISGWEGLSWRFIVSGTEKDMFDVIQTLKTNPDSRRIIVSAWNVADLPKMALMPCHAFFQFYVADGKLSCQLYQRSADVFLGVPFNIASYALLTMMVAQVCDLALGDFVWTGGDTHLYSNHMEQVDLQLTRSPRPLPTMRINPNKKDILDFVYEDFTLENYDPYPGIKAPVAI